MTGESWAQGQVVLFVRFEPQLQVPNKVIDTVGRYLGSALRLGEDESTWRTAWVWSASDFALHSGDMPRACIAVSISTSGVAAC